MLKLAKGLISSEGRLSRRTAQATFWSVALRSSRVLRLASILLLARILPPSEFGVMGIALLAMELVEFATQANFDIALVQRKGNIEPFLRTTWTLQVIRGFLLGIVTVALAPFVAAFFDAPGAERLLQVLALSFVIRGFVNIGVVYFQKDLELHKRFLLQVSRIMTSSLVIIVLALTLESVWALVFGALAGRAVMLVLSYVLHPYRPRPGFDMAQFRELWGFSKWVFATTILTYMAQNVDKVFIGKMMGTTSLGLYQLAYRLSHFFATQARHVGGDVALPVYSMLQDTRKRLVRTFLRGNQLSALVAFPVTAGMIVVAPTFIPVILGAKWMSMVPAFQVLTVAGLFSTIEGVGFTQLLRAVGRPELTTRLTIIRLGVVVALIYPLSTSFGLVGAASAVTFGSLASFLVGVRLVLDVSDCKLVSYLKTMYVPALSSIVMVIIVLVVRESIPGDAGVVSLALTVAVGALTYVAGVLFFDLITGRHIVRIVQHYLTPAQAAR